MSIQYLNTNRPFIINNEIIEWDIRAANISLIKEYLLLPDKIIKKIPTDDKDKRERHVGLLMRDNKNFAKALESKFTDVVEEFIKNNELDVEYDIITIKRDAVFVVSKIIKNPTIGNYIEFRPKGRFHAYLQIEKCELYFGGKDKNGKKIITVKGVSDHLLPLHENGMLYLFAEVIDICESSNMDKRAINTFMKDFVKKYKKKELDLDFYREFNGESKFKCRMYEQTLLLDNIDEYMLDNVDIEYNYINFILPLIRMVC